jgi:ArsR family transcriptional regulator
MSTINPPIQASEQDGAMLPMESMARICKALGHPVRMQIVALLKAEDPCFCGQIVSRLPLAQSTVSQHLKHLREAGIVTGEIEGSGTIYCLNRGLLRRFNMSLAHFVEGLR